MPILKVYPHYNDMPRECVYRAKSRKYMTTHRVIVQTAGNPDQFRTQHAQAYIKHPVLCSHISSWSIGAMHHFEIKCAAMIT